MLPSNLNLNIGKTVRYRNKVLIKNIDRNTGLNGNINRSEVYHQKSRSPAAQLKAYAAPEMHSMKSSDKSIKDAVTMLPASNQKMLAKSQNDEKLAFKLLILGTESFAYHGEMKMIGILMTIFGAGINVLALVGTN